jgi:phage terminase large subunit
VRDRVNCVNAKLCNQAGTRRLLIDARCKQLIQDLERVHWKTDSNGNPLNEIDKSDPARTHTSDALGYMIASQFSMRAPGGYRSEYIA